VQTTHVIKLDAIHKTYHTGEVDVHAVRGVSLEILPGEFVAIMGSSGSGKSTLMNMIGGLDRPTGGHYWLDGIDISTLNRDALADIRNEKIGFVFQGFNLLSRTSALENAELPLLYDRQKRIPNPRLAAEQALDRVGLKARMDHEPNRLSGGEQQRVAIARALINKPAILLADEPTGNLDTRTSMEILALFQKLNNEGLTVILVTHEPDIAQCAKRTIERRDGLVLSDKPVKKRLEAHRIFSSRSQADKAVTV
jgi:putative ABC transport system ATP-binding protein